MGCAPCQPYSTYSRSTDAADGDGPWALPDRFAGLVEETRPHVVWRMFPGHRVLSAAPGVDRIEPSRNHVWVHFDGDLDPARSGQTFRRQFVPSYFGQAGGLRRGVILPAGGGPVRDPGVRTAAIESAREFGTAVVAPCEGHCGGVPRGGLRHPLGVALIPRSRHRQDCLFAGNCRALKG